MVGVGVQMKINENEQHEIVRVLPDSPAREAGLKKGDIITAINNKNTKGRSLDELIDNIRETERNVTFIVQRGTESITFKIPVQEITSISVYVDTLNDILDEAVEEYDSIRYVAVTSISNNTATTLKSVINNLQKEKVTGVIFDFRDNTGGYLDVAIDICKLLVPSGPICHIVDAKGKKEIITSNLKKTPFEKIVVLVDRYTASGAELITAAMQDAKIAVVVGEVTYGKGVIQQMFSFPTGGGLKLTTEEYLRRSGEKINEIGVIPDIIVESNFNDYETPRDEALLKAVSILIK
jgi:carboxyl-terminal processing protease